MGDQLPVLIGESPGVDITDRPNLALTGATGQRIAGMAGLTWLDYLMFTDRRNVFSVPTPRWSARSAKLAAEAMAPSLEGRTFVLLGDKVARAFGAEKWPPYEWRPLCSGNASRAPHPSGRNRVFNDPAERKRFGAFMRQVIRDR